MTLRKRWKSCVLAFIATCLLAPPAGADFETKKLEALLSANETKGGGDSNWTLKWNLKGRWLRPGTHSSFGISVDSDYAKSDASKVDRLRMGFRLLDKDYGKVTRKWYPVYLIQTEGDHSFDSVHTLGAAGFRQKRRYGFLELTAGASKDIRASEEWVGDVGAEIGYESMLGDRWKFSTGPKGEFGAFGSMRLREDRLRYSWDVSLDYKVSEKLGIGYRLWYGNTVPNSDRTQYIGVKYMWK